MSPHTMKSPCYFYILVFMCLILSSQGQAEDFCITCAFADTAKSSLGTWFDDFFFPTAGGALQLFQTNPEPQAEPAEQKKNDLPGQFDQPGADIELEVTADPADNEKCDPNSAGSTLSGTQCAVATAQIVWLSPFSCGDRVQAQRIFDRLTELAPTGNVLAFENDCGTAFFTAPLSPPSIDKLMAENIGIEAIIPDDELKDSIVGLPRIQRREWINSISVEESAPSHLAYISTPPNYDNIKMKYAYFGHGGFGATIYWIDTELYLPNEDISYFDLPDNRLAAEHIALDGDTWANPSRDQGGCKLSIICGDTRGVLREPKIKFVKVNTKMSSFLSGLQAILGDLKLRTSQNERVHRWTVVGTGLTVPSPSKLSSRFSQRKATELIKDLIYSYDVVFVVSAGLNEGSTTTVSNWPASIAGDVQMPIIVAGAIETDTHTVPSYSPENPFVSVHAPGLGWCKHGLDIGSVIGTSVASAIVTALAADFLTRPYLRQSLFIDKPSDSPFAGTSLALLPVSAKIRNHMRKISYDRLGRKSSELKAVWNGLNPENLNEYM